MTDDSTAVVAEAKLRRLLIEIYGEPGHKTRALMKSWQELYGLPELASECQVDESFMSFWRHKTVNFVVVAVFNYRDEHLQIFSHRPIGPDEVVGWRLPGGPVLADRGELIEESARHAVLMETHLHLDDLLPLALVVNTFSHGQEKVVHHGIAFVARADASKLAMSRVVTSVEEVNGAELLRRSVNKETKGLNAEFTGVVPEKMAFANRAVLELARERILAGTRLRSGRAAVPHPEVLSGRRLGVRFAKFLHRFTVKQLLHFFASRRVKSRIKTHLNDGPMASFLDAAAGDDTFVCEVASDSNPRLCVANDISWKDMDVLRKRSHAKHLKMLFTNHNADNLPFALRFDVVLFKNALHHAQNADDVLRILESLRRVSKRLIIVDVEDPRKRFGARLFNWYYTKVLQDEGQRFLDWGQFQYLITLCFGQAKFDLIWTIKGRYMFAMVDCNEPYPAEPPT